MELGFSAYGVGVWGAADSSSINVYGLGWVDIKLTGGNQKLHVASPGEINVRTGNGDDFVSIDEGGGIATRVNVGDGNDTIHLTSGLATNLVKGTGSLRLDGSAYRGGWTTLDAVSLGKGSSLQSSSYGNTFTIQRADSALSVDIYALEGNIYTAKSGTGNQTVRVAAGGYNTVSTADGDDDIAVVLGGRNSVISTGNGKDKVYFDSGINASVSKGRGSLDFSQRLYLSGVLQISTETAMVNGASNSYGLSLNIDNLDASQPWQVGRWKAYALGYADLAVNSRASTWYADVFGGSNATASLAGQNSLRISALIGTTITDNGGNNYLTTGVQYGANTVWTLVQRNAYGATTMDLLGQKLDVRNNTGAGNQFLFNNGGVVANLSFGRSGNGVIDGQFGAWLPSNISMGESYNYVLNARDHGSSYSFGGNGNFVLDLTNQGQYQFSSGNNNAALLTHGNLNAMGARQTVVHTMASMTKSAVASLSDGSTLVIHVPFALPRDAQLLLYKDKDLGRPMLDLYLVYQDDKHKTVSHRIQTVIFNGALPETVQIDLGGQGNLLLTDLNSDVARPLLGTGANAVFKFITNQHGSGSDAFIVEGEQASLQSSLVQMLGAKSLLTLPGLTNNGGISNGNFNRGLVDFSSDYRLSDNPTGFDSVGMATLTTLAPDWGFATRNGPNGAGSKFLLVDGANDASKAFWRSDVSGLVAGDKYTLNFGMINGNGAAPARVQLYVNGVATEAFVTSKGSEGWVNRSISFKVPQGSSPVRLELKDLETAANSNDFGFANVSLKLAASVATEAAVSVTTPTATAPIVLNDFITEYSFTSDPTKFEGAGSVTQTTLAPDWGFATRAGPNGAGSKFLLVDGGAIASKAFWRNDVSGLTAGDNYTIHLSLINGTGSAPARLQLYVNGVAQGDVVSSKGGEAWVDRSISFQVPWDSSTVRLEFKDLETASDSNDFGFANVCLTHNAASARAITDFSTDYQRATDSSPITGAGQIYETTNMPSYWKMTSSVGPARSGSKFVQVDGASDAGKAFWRHYFDDLAPNQLHTVQFSVINGGNGTLARVQLYVNGVAMGDPLAPQASQGWVTGSLTFRTPASGPVRLEFKDLETAGTANDFCFGNVTIQSNLALSPAGASAAPTAPVLTSAPDFTRNIADFSTDYQRVAGSSSITGAGQIYETTNMPSYWKVASQDGPTGPNSKFIQVDGATDASKAFWRHAFDDLPPHQMHTVQFSVINGGTGTLARVQLYVNGVATGNPVSPMTSQGWVTGSVSFRTPDGGPVVLEFKDMETASDSNDFCFGNVVLSHRAAKDQDSSLLVATPTIQGVAQDWVRDVRVLYAQTPQEVGELRTLTTYQNYLLANNVYGVAMLKDIDPVGIASLAPEFFRHVSAALLVEWGKTGRLASLTQPQIDALPINTALEMLYRGNDRQLASDVADAFYERIAHRIDALPQDARSPLTAQMLNSQVIAHLDEATVRGLNKLPVYGTLSADLRNAITDAVTRFDSARNDRNHLAGMFSLANDLPGLSADVLEQISPELSDVALKNMLDLKVPAWKMWAFGYPYGSISYARGFFGQWIADMKAQLPTGDWEAGMSQIRDTLNHWNPGSSQQQRLLQSFDDLDKAHETMKNQLQKTDSTTSAYQSVRFYASVYRLLGAAGTMGVDIERATDQKTLALAATKLTSNILSSLQVPVAFLAQSVVNKSVEGQHKQLSSWADFKQFWKEKSLTSALSDIFKLRGEMVSPFNTDSIIKKYTNALKAAQADPSRLAEELGAAHRFSSEPLALQSALDSMLKDAEPKPTLGGSSTPEAIRISVSSLVCLTADLAGIATSIFSAVSAGQALTSNPNLTPLEQAGKSFTIIQQFFSTLSGISYLAGDVIGWWNSMASVSNLFELTNASKFGATGAEVGAALGIIAAGIDVLVQGMSFTSGNVLGPVLALIQDAIYVTIDIIAMSNPEIAPVLFALELLLPNFQAAVTASAMNDKLSLIKELGNMVGGDPTGGRDWVLEKGYLAACAPFKALYMTERSQLDQMIGAAVPLGGLIAPMAMRAATTTLKNRIQYEPDFSDGPGNSVNAQSNFAKVVAAENLIFNFLTSDVAYLNGGSGLIDWGKYGSEKGGRQSMAEKLALLSKLYQQDFRYMFNVLSGKSITLPNGDPVSDQSHALFTDMGIYTGLVKIAAPTHMYHQSWRIDQDGSVDLFMAAARMADIDKNLNPDVINAISLGLAGESVHLSTAEGKRVNLYFISDGDNAKGRDEHLYLEKGNFLIKATSTDAQQHMVLHAGDGASTLDGAREMVGSDQSPTTFLASAQTKLITGSAKQADTLGFTNSLNLSAVNIKEGTISYDYLDGKDSKKGSLSYTDIQNFAVSHQTDRIDFSLDSNHPASLLVTNTAKQISINSGKQPVVILADQADNSRVDFYTSSGEIAVNTIGNKVVLHKAGASSVTDSYTLSARAGNELDAYDAMATTRFQMRSEGTAPRPATTEWKGLGSRQAENDFSFGLSDLLGGSKHAQLFVSGGNGVEDAIIDRIDLSNIAGSLMKTTSLNAADIGFTVRNDAVGSYTVGDHKLSTNASSLVVSVSGKDVMEVRSLRDFTAAKVDFYLDNALLSHQVIG